MCIYIRDNRNRKEHAGPCCRENRKQPVITLQEHVDESVSTSLSSWPGLHSRKAPACKFPAGLQHPARPLSLIFSHGRALFAREVVKATVQKAAISPLRTAVSASRARGLNISSFCHVCRQSRLAESSSPAARRHRMDGLLGRR